jgi:hypothetical protein
LGEIPLIFLTGTGKYSIWYTKYQTTYAIKAVQTLMPNMGTTKDENKHPLPPLPPQRGRVRVGGGSICVLKYEVFKNLIWTRVLCNRDLSIGIKLTLKKKIRNKDVR